MNDIRRLQGRGRYVRLLDGRVFVMDTGERLRTNVPPLIILHGFPTSCHDFVPCIETLKASRRVLTFDFLGFGLSDKPKRFSYSLHEQTDLALAVAREAGISRAHVWAHDMGTSVATELCARRERGLLHDLELASLTLMNGSVHVELAKLTLGQKLLRSPLGSVFVRVSNRASFQRQMRALFAQPVAAATLEEMWQLLELNDGVLRLPSTIRYVSERYLYWDRWIGALRRLELPTLIAWGERDPVAIMPIARALAAEIPHAKLVTWPELGHYPQVEAPGRVCADLSSFLATVDQATASQ